MPYHNLIASYDEMIDSVDEVLDAVCFDLSKVGTVFHGRNCWIQV